MAARTRRRAIPDIWPGFVDAISTLLIIIIFLLMVFTLAQHFLTETLTGRNAALDRLNRQVAELADLLSLEQQASAGLRTEVSQLSAELQSSIARRDNLSSQLASALEDRDRLTAALADARAEAAKASKDLEDAFKTIEVDRSKLTARLGELELLRRDIATLRELRAKLEKDVTAMAASIKAKDSELTAIRDKSRELEARLSTEAERTALAQKKIEETELKLSQMSDQAGKANDQVARLNRQIAALRQQLARISAVLQASEAKTREQNVQIANLGKRLNAALANKVQELARYRSEFFGRLREVLGDRKDIRIVGDRFVFQSEVLFDSAADTIRPEGRQRIAQLADTLKEISSKIPKNLDWVLRVDGHTDRLPIRTRRFPSNWELSTARAVSVVKFLIANGLPADRLVAAGFGQYHPIDTSTDAGALRRNRRIEFKLTNR